MKKLKNLKSQITKIWIGLNTQFIIGLTMMQCAFAENGTGSVDKFQEFICSWVIKIGGFITFVGGIMFAVSWARQDAEGKSNALFVLMAGFMVAGIGAAPSIFGL